MAIEDDYRIYEQTKKLKEQKSIPIKITPVKTLTEWFDNLPLIYKLDLYNSYLGTITKHFKNPLDKK